MTFQNFTQFIRTNLFYIASAGCIFIVIYGLLSYLGASHTTSPPYNMGIPVANYVGQYWATYIANIAISVPLTIIIIWILILLIKIVFKVNLFEIVKGILGNNPIVEVLDVLDKDIEKVEVNTAKFIHTLKMGIVSEFDILPYRKQTSSSLDTGIANPLTPPLSQSFYKEVFNVPNNVYTYKEAPAVCASYNSKLATRKEVEGAYDDNKEWCNYGWSADQVALFPTQKNTYRALQGQKGHENDCGKPGVNGGYFDENMQFGVNCYGLKPSNL